MKKKYSQFDQYEDLHRLINSSDHVDIKVVEGSVTLREFISGCFSYHPKWMILLFKIRELLVKVLNLKQHDFGDSLPSLSPHNVSFKPGDKGGFFVVRGGKEDTYWIAEAPDDNHLKAYIAIVSEGLDNTLKKFYLITIVKYIHWTGPIYFNFIRPFHHLVVTKMAKAGVQYTGVTRKEK